jgi:parvulin-like peptidyl-prolyl isomerase
VTDSDRRARALLALGTAGGIALAAFGIVRSGSEPVDTEGAVALVNGQPISREAFARFAAAVAAERKEVELDPAMRERLLERMIDEELLFQRGVALGLARHEPTARRSIVAALVASIGADAEVAEPHEASLREFYDGNRERFTRPGRLGLAVALVRSGDRPEALAFREAQEIARRVRAGELLERVREELGDAPLAPLPGGTLPFETLRQYLGPSVARAAFRLEPGEVSEPTRGSDGYYVLQLRERVAGELAPFEEVRAQVQSELLRSRGDEALREYLSELRESGEVRILEAGGVAG